MKKKALSLLVIGYITVVLGMALVQINKPVQPSTEPVGLPAVGFLIFFFVLVPMVPSFLLGVEISREVYQPEIVSHPRDRKTDLKTLREKFKQPISFWKDVLIPEVFLFAFLLLPPVSSLIIAYLALGDLYSAIVMATPGVIGITFWFPITIMTAVLFIPKHTDDERIISKYYKHLTADQKTQVADDILQKLSGGPPCL